jgi:acyl-CoA thioesterase I
MRARAHTRRPRSMTIRALACAGLLLVVLVCAACAPSAPNLTRPAPTPPTGTVTPPVGPAYVAIGASDAFGLGTDHPDRDNWPTVLAVQLSGVGVPSKQLRLLNLGVPGATVAQANRDELPIALDARPAVITVFLGVNDLDYGVTLPTFTANLRMLLSTLATLTTARVFVGNLPDLTLLPYFQGKDHLDTLRTEVTQWNAAIAAICKDEGADLVDLYSGWSQLAAHPEYIAHDGLHPSTIGARQLAGLFAEAIISTTPSTG